MPKIAYKMGIIKLAAEKKWSQKLKEYIDTLIDIGTPQEVKEFVYENVSDSYPQATRIRKYVEERLGR